MVKQPSAVRKRVKHTRSPDGCGTCKIRRVRCDQARPYCARCSSTGRKCDGYLTQVVPSDPSLGLDDKLSILPKLLPLEAVALRHFQDHTSKDLAGVFVNDFWRTTVLQFSMRHQCIRNVAIALASLQAHLQPRQAKVLPNQVLRSTALSYYASGIRDLNKHIHLEGWSSLEAVIACSVLCVMFEWRQDNHALALKHLYSSLRVIGQWEETATSSQRPIVRPSINSPTGHFIISTLAPIVRRMFVQNLSLIPVEALTFPNAAWPKMELKDFDTPREAFESIIDLLGQEDALPNARLSQSAARHRILTLQGLWSAKLDEVLRKLPAEDPVVAMQVTQLEIWRRISRLLALRCCAFDQPIYITYAHLIEEILDLCVKVSLLQTSEFSADMSIVPALYFIAFNSRSLAIRWKAVSILEASSRREGIWDSKKAALLARRSILKDEQVRYRETDGARRYWDLRVDFDNEGCVWP